MKSVINRGSSHFSQLNDPLSFPLNIFPQQIYKAHRQLEFTAVESADLAIRLSSVKEQCHCILSFPLAHTYR